jgi:F0F1-type ATP synthase membrane subunit c/vacuolar-type H+-ATPase subunit K
MRKDEMEAAITEFRIEKEVTKRVRARCIAFWSGMMMGAGMVGSWLSNNIQPVKAAGRAFWEAWGKMKNIPYYFIAGFSIFGCMVTGMALASGADYIRYQAEVSAQGRIFNAMTIRELSNVRVGDI